MRKLPPLNSLRVFDAVARNGSLSKAASELCVSPSAVSQQISNLENWLGVRLLDRSSNKTSLSQNGHQFSKQIKDTFDNLEEDVSQIHEIRNDEEIRLSVLPSLASRWLIHRLPQFRALHPRYRVMVEASFDQADFNPRELTLAIRSGTGLYPGCHATKLFDEYVAPACSPDYWKKHAVALEDIGNRTLLADHTVGTEKTNLDWGTWMYRENVQPTGNLEPSQLFTDSNLTIQAAINGEGFMLGRSVLINEEIARGTLITPFSNRQLSDWPYFVVYPEKYHPPRTALKLIVNWLCEQANETPGSIRHNVTTA
ncbi:LysR substrate-binding domain-containing protein [Pseudohalocynthiibacter aestuariivivens]|uniref:LysR substrate-binding domain-containing protein n=1 Tax=Pseudohalocynthiibacter aestuariivivens TaxID=1591409 RepID=A0ABV5JBX9_9RHOB|nr:LysR substrate-binding domain-containing protein [Pseudohalocynthiibacter aestuariivivens]MBS9718645.1 LysR family transcriptional regulator [Pseudohalocynthiibacter aestuariivivens]